MSRRKAITLVGIGDDGCIGLTSRAITAISSADILAGGERQLEFFPEFHGERIALRGGLASSIDRIAELALDHSVCVLASGDPLFFGVGAQLIRKVGAEHVEVIAQPSSVQLAFSRIGVSWQDAGFLSVHGRPMAGLVTRLQRLAKAAILTDETNSPARVAAHLLAHGEIHWQAWVCECLGGPDERVRRFEIPALAEQSDVATLNVLLLLRADPRWQPPPMIPFLHEDEFAKRMPKKGLITKREVRLLSLAALAIHPTSVVWDIGAGSGSVSIEAARLAPEGRVYAVEVDPESVQICGDNLRSHRVDNVVVVAGRAPAALAELEDPDAVFIGGSKGELAAIIELVLTRLRPGGRLVINAITLENASEAYQVLRRHQLIPEVTLLQVSRAEPLAHYLRYEALNPIQIFTVRKTTVTPEPQ